MLKWFRTKPDQAAAEPLLSRLEQTARELKHRVQVLEDDNASLERRFESLRHSVGRYLTQIREMVEYDDDDDSEQEDLLSIGGGK